MYGSERTMHLVPFLLTWWMRTPKLVQIHTTLEQLPVVADLPPVIVSVTHLQGGSAVVRGLSGMWYRPVPYLA